MSNQRVVLLLHGGIEFDSRVKREAVSLAAAGLDVYVICPSVTGEREDYLLHGVKIIELPVAYGLLDAQLAQSDAQPKSSPSRRDLWKRRLSPREALQYANAKAALYANRLIEERGESRYFKTQRLFHHQLQRTRRWAMRRPRALRAPAMLGVRLHGRVMRASAGHRPLFDVISGRWWQRLTLRRQARQWKRRLELQRALIRGPQRPSRSPKKAPEPKHGRRQSWEETEPQLLDLDIAFGRLIDRLAPAVIHANDFHTLPTAVHAKRRAVAGGRSVKVLYDSHEDAAGLREHYGARRSEAFAEVEATYVGEVDAIVTVSPQLADRLQHRYALKTQPAVVLNAPPQGSAHSEVPSLRRLIGLGASVSLGVYAGGVNKNRGLDLLIESVGRIPGFHVALVLTAISQRTEDLLIDLTKRFGVEDRVHIVPAVLPHQVAAYLSEGDLGFVVASNEVANHNVSLPNKLFEYLHAGLPIVTSNLAALEEFVEEHGVGCVFPYPDVDSLVKCVGRVLENKPMFRQAITPAFLRTFSWEGSQETLLSVYGDLLSIQLQPAPIPLDLTVHRHPDTS